MEKEHIRSYQSLHFQEVLDSLKTKKEGLSGTEAMERLKQFGTNSINTSNNFSYLQTIIRGLSNPFSVILIIATVLSFASQHFVDAGIIFAVLCINIGIETYHKRSAHKNIELLKKGVTQMTTVVRDNKVLKIDTEFLVPGDIVLLEEGSFVPADGRLIEVTHLSINESSLTGESLPVAKNINKISGVLPVSDFHNMAWLGSTVMEGSGTMVVTATGLTTQFGVLSQKLQETKRGKNPFLDRIKNLSKTIGIAGLLITLIIFLIRFGILDNDLNEIIIFSLAVLVSIIPESLPTVINITLARGAKHLADEHAVVKELSTIESVGGTTVILTDKTGTLTENSMKVEYCMVRSGEEYEVTGFGWKSVGMFMKNNHKFDPRMDEELSLLLDFSLLSNRSHVYEEDGEDKIIGEATEAALLVLAQKDQRSREEILKTYNIVSRTRFLHTKKILVTIVEKDSQKILLVVGAPETVWSLSDAPDKARTKTEEQANRGLRTIAYAYTTITGDTILEDSLPTDMTYLGFVAMRDPIRQGVKEMLPQVKDAGVRIIMATGDHARTALYIGKELGIIHKGFENVLTGTEFLALDEKQRKEILKTTNVFARVSPEIKSEIIKILQKNKEVVTMIGDGVNDTLALRQADVGVAMGNSGTDAARNASSMVLTNDNFITIVHAIFRGRHVSKNIRQVTNFLLSTNVAEALVLVMVTFLGMPLPLIATQILLINLVTDGVGALPFAFKKPELSILPRPTIGQFLSPRDYGAIGSATFGMTLATLLAFSFFLKEGLPYAQTMAFTVLSLTQIGRLISLDTNHHSLFTFKGNPWLFRCIGISLSILCLVFVIPGLREIFHLELLHVGDFILAFLLSLIPMFTSEIYKIVIKLSHQTHHARIT